MRRLSSSIRLLLALPLVALFALGAVVIGDAARARRARFPAEDDLLYLPKPSALKAMALGHHELVADLVFIRAIIYFGGQFYGSRDYRWLENYLDTIVSLDPEWKTPYRWAGVATMYDGRTITNASVMQSNHFLELGIQRFPRDWELHFMLGCNYLFELKTDDPRQKVAWRRKGAELVRHAALVGGGPPWVPLLAATMMREEGENEAAVRHLEEVFLSTQDEKTREEVKNRLISLHAKIDLARAEKQRAEFEEEWKKTVPYASPDLFVHIGPKRSPRMDLEELARDAVIDANLDADQPR
jgi:hypothetical protein